MQELRIICRAWVQARLQLRVVDWEPLPWLVEGVIVQATGLAGVYAAAQLLQLLSAEKLLEDGTPGVAGASYQPAVSYRVARVRERRVGKVTAGSRTARAGAGASTSDTAAHSHVRRHMW